MADSSSIHVSVCHALPEKTWSCELTLKRGVTAAEAVAASGFCQAFPEVDPLAHGLAIYGPRCADDHPLRDGDRVEILRPLVFDPKESRRRRAEHKRQQTQR